MRPAFVVFVRNKASYVAECVRTVLAQDYSPMTLVFSDQMSEDGTFDIIKAETAKYNGPNEILLLQCPKTEHRGMPGLLDHINWLHSRLDFDYWITMAGDDLAYPMRARRVMDVVEEHKPLYVATCQNFANHNELIRDGVADSVTAYPNESRFVNPVECISEMVGGSTSNAWNPELLEEFGPLPYHALVDVYVPFCAAMKQSMYYIHEPLHIYVRRPDDNNTGLEGRIRQASGDAEVVRVQELMMYQLCANHILMMKTAEGFYDRNQDRDDINNDLLPFLYTKIMAQAAGWATKRLTLSMNNIPPMGLPI